MEQRSTRARRWTVRGAAALVAVLALGLSACTPRPAPVELVGHGWGHGRGMGQWGALGYAVDHGWDWTRILDHYYGGTVAGTGGDPIVSVDLRAHTGAPVAFVSERGGLRTSADDGLPGGRVPHTALRLERVGANRWRVHEGPHCAGPWTRRPDVTAHYVDVLPPVPASEDHRDLLQLCEGTGVRWYRGSFRIVDTGDTSNVVNRLRMQQYLRGVVPRESPASWAGVGGGRGMHALRSQAVAARSYAHAERRATWARTCDTISCQVYGGYALQRRDLPFTRLEDPRTDAAVAETAGVVRIRDGAVARTEFSSSTGGWSAGGTFPAVPDAGDDIAANPNHTWRVTLTAAALERAFPGRGAFQALRVTSRNGLGDLGGRALTVRVRFSGATVDVSGDAFRSALGLRSTWFRQT